MEIVQQTTTKPVVAATLRAIKKNIAIGVNHTTQTIASIQHLNIALDPVNIVCFSSCLTFRCLNNIPRPKKNTIIPNTVKSLIAAIIFEGTALYITLNITSAIVISSPDASTASTVMSDCCLPIFPGWIIHALYVYVYV